MAERSIVGLNGPRPGKGTGRKRNTLINLRSKMRTPGSVTPKKPTLPQLRKDQGPQAVFGRDAPAIDAAMKRMKEMRQAGQPENPVKAAERMMGFESAGTDLSSTIEGIKDTTAGNMVALFHLVRATNGAAADPKVMKAPGHSDGSVQQNVRLAKQLAKKLYGWTDAQWQALRQLWSHESGFRSDAANPTSSARGIPQALMSEHFGSSWQDDPAARRYLRNPKIQILWGLKYIADRYGNPMTAWKHWLSRVPIDGRDVGNWY